MTKSLTKIATLSLTLLATTPAWAESAPSAADLFPGVWRMVSLEAGPAGGEMSEVAYSGQIVFTDAGTVSVQAMDPDPEATSPYVLNGYEAFYGTFDLDEDADTLVLNVDSSLARTLIGQSMERAYEISDDTLVLTPTSADENWRVVYERD